MTDLARRPAAQPARSSTRVWNWRGRLLVNLRRHRGNITVAAQKTGIDPGTVWRHMMRDPAFAARVREQQTIGQQRAADQLEDVSYDQALNGTTRPVYQGGQLVGAVKEFDHKLQIRWLETLRPEKWSPLERHEHGGVGGGPIRIQFNCSDNDEALEAEDADVEEHQPPALPEGDPHGA